MYSVSVETHFRASHQLTMSNGSKEPLHYHNWVVVAEVSSEKLNNIGLVMDFCSLKTSIDKIVAKFDNIQLDSINYFKQHNSSAENVAQYISDKLEPKLPDGVKLSSINVAEEPGCSAKFSK